MRGGPAGREYRCRDEGRPKATRLRQALHATLNIDRVRTGDLGGNAGTAAFSKALVSRITNG